MRRELPLLQLINHSTAALQSAQEVARGAAVQVVRPVAMEVVAVEVVAAAAEVVVQVQVVGEPKVIPMMPALHHCLSRE